VLLLDLRINSIHPRTNYIKEYRPIIWDNRRFTIGRAMDAPLNCEKSRIWLKHTTLQKLPQWKITKIVATRCQILRLKCAKFDFGKGSLQRSLNPLAVFNGSYF